MRVYSDDENAIIMWQSFTKMAPFLNVSSLKITSKNVGVDAIII